MSFTCPQCGMTSHNPNDEREGYCGNCHAFTGQVPSEIPELAKQLLMALVEIEDQAIDVAREGGCKCDQPLPVPHADRNYPACRYDYARSVGKPFHEIEWELVHQPGCPMGGQKGVGYARNRPEHA